MSNLDILKKTFQDLKISWSTAFLASLPLSLLPSVIVFDKTIGLLLILVLSGVLRAGLSKVTLFITTQQSIKVHNVFDGFLCFKHTLGVFLLSVVFIVLGLLLFIVPGIIIAIWLSQSFFILVENPSLEPMDVFKKSKEMMKGKELKYFYLLLVFVIFSLVLFYFNMVFLSLLIVPVQYIAFANFYNSLKN